MTRIAAALTAFLGLAMAEQNENFDLSQAPRFKLEAVEPLAGTRHGSSNLQDPAADMKDGPGENASFNDPQALVLLPDGKGLLVWEWRADAVRRIDMRTQRVTTVSGPGWAVGGRPLVRRWHGKSMAYLPSADALFLGGDPVIEVDLGSGRASSLGLKGEVAADPRRNRLFVRYTERDHYLKTGSKFGLLDPVSGAVAFLAGGEEAGDADGSGAAAGFRGVEDMGVDPESGDLYVLELVKGRRNRFRRISPSGRTETVGMVPGRQRLMTFVVDGRAGYVYGFTTGKSLLRMSLKGLAVTGWAELHPPMEGYAVTAVRGERPGEFYAADGMFGQKVWRLSLDMADQRLSEGRLPSVSVRLADASPGAASALAVEFATPPGADLPAGRGSISIGLRRSGLVVPASIGPDAVTVAVGGGAPAAPALVAPGADGTLRLVLKETVPAGSRVVVEFRKGVLACQDAREGGKRIAVWTSAHPQPRLSKGYAIGPWRSGLTRVEGDPDDLVSEVLGDIPISDTVRPGDFEGPFSTRRLMVSFKPDATVADANEVLAHIQGTVIGSIDVVGMVSVRIPGGMGQALEWLSRHPKVAAAAPDALMVPRTNDEKVRPRRRG